MNNRSKPDSLLATLVAVGQFSLVLLGLIGLSVEFFRDNGWLKQLLSKLASSPAGLASIPIAIVAVYFLNRWLVSASHGTTSKGDLPMYIMMAIGAYFLFNLVTSGSF